MTVCSFFPFHFDYFDPRAVDNNTEVQSTEEHNCYFPPLSLIKWKVGKVLFF